ncbi:MAG: hypothetical protein ABUS48_02095 [Pseudomonadota bacterium]
MNAHEESGRSRGLLREWGPRALFESCLIVFSIVLALAINNYVADLQTQARVKEARAFFIREIQANRAAILSDAYLPYHQRLLGTISAIDVSRPLSAAESTSALSIFHTGLHFAPLRDVVWRSFSSSDVFAHMPPRLVFALNDAYQAQEQLQTMTISYYPQLSQIPGELGRGADPRVPISSLDVFMGDVVATESNLPARYDRALAELEKN